MKATTLKYGVAGTALAALGITGLGVLNHLRPHRDVESTENRSSSLNVRPQSGDRLGDHDQGDPGAIWPDDPNRSLGETLSLLLRNSRLARTEQGLKFIRDHFAHEDSATWLESVAISGQHDENFQEMVKLCAVSLASAGGSFEAFLLLDRLASTRARTGTLPQILLAWALSEPDFLERPEVATRLSMIEMGYAQSYQVLALANNGDVESALQLVNELPLGANRWSAVRYVAGALANTDHNQYISWLNSLEFPEERKEAISGASNALSKLPPEDYRSFLSRLNGDDASLRKKLFVNYFAHHPEQSLLETWIAIDKMAQNAGEAEAAKAVVFNGWVGSDPAAAASFLEELGDPEFRAESIESVASNYASIDIPGAVAWFDTLSSNIVEQETAAKHIVRHWVRLDSTGASDWLLELPIGEARDSGIMELISFLSDYGDVDSAVRWSEELSSPAKRSSIATSVRQRSTE